MEQTGGEPDVVKYDKEKNEFTFFDCSQESPTGRRNCVYDRDSEKWLKKNKFPHDWNGNAVDIAAAMSIKILTKEEYKYLQTLGRFDEHTYNFIETTADIRKPIHKKDPGMVLIASREGIELYVRSSQITFRRDNVGFRASLSI